MNKESKPNSEPSGNINVGNISNSTGVAVGHGASAIVTQGVSSKEIAALFRSLSQKVAELPESPSKTIAGQAVVGLEEEVSKGDSAQEDNLRTWFNFLARAAPDIWEVAVSALSNPIAGVAAIVKLVAKKAKEENQ